MSASYICKTVIGGGADAVYDALATEAGIKGWWTTTCQVGKRVGENSKFHFGKTYNVMRIEKLQPGAELHWSCVEHYHHAPGELTRFDEWVGTKLMFRLTPQTQGRTVFEFEHEGLHPQLECYGISERAWDLFLQQSLKQYVETGRGQPFLGHELK